MSRIGQVIRRAGKYILHGVPVNNITASIQVSQPERCFDGKHIIVTGGGRGLGYAIAKKLHSGGARVLISGRDENTLRQSAEEIGCNWLQLDVQNVEQFPAFITKAEEILGGLDCLVNNAGISLHESSFLDVTPDGFDRQFNTNLRGTFFLTQQFISFIERRGQDGGVVLFISSETGDTVDLRPYGLSKAAVNSLVQGLAHAYASRNIRINAVAPGVTATDMTGVKSDNLYYSDSTINRAYLPEEMAEVACFLLSDLSGCVSGQIITCNNAKTVNARWKK